MRQRQQFNVYLRSEYAQHIRDEAAKLDSPIGEVIEDMWDAYSMANLRDVVRQFIRRVSGRKLPMDQRHYLERLQAEIALVLAENKPGTKAEPQ